MNLRINKGDKMSFYSNLKDICIDATQLMQEKDSSGKIVYLLKKLSFVVLCLLYLIDKCGFRAIISCNIDVKIGLPQEMSDFLSIHNMLIFIGAYFIYFLLYIPIIRIIAVKIKTRWDKDIFPVCFTVEDVFEIFFWGTILLKTVQDFLQCLKGNNVMQGMNLWIYVFVAISASLRFISKLYIQNKNRWYHNTIRYTNFLDSDGKRIAKDDSVVYRNRNYEIYNNKGIWYLSDSHIGRNIKLEDAVMDNEGKLRIYFFNMERRKEDNKV